MDWTKHADGTPEKLRHLDQETNTAATIFHARKTSLTLVVAQTKRSHSKKKRNDRASNYILKTTLHCDII